MYESFYGLTEKPFTLLPDPDYLYLSPKHQRALTLLEYGMMNQAGFSVICGDTGAGKTTLIRRLLVGLGEDTTVGLITNTHQSFGDLLSWVLMAFGIDSEGKNKAQMHQIFIDFLIQQYANNLHTVLIVDEAQNMNAETLEELRMLSNINADKDQVLQVILAGQPGLRNTLRKPELMQFAQRISVDYYLESLSSDETELYIKHRLKVAGSEKQIFTTEACEAIYRYSGGTPRLINLLCDTTLVYGFAEQTDLIGVGLVDDVVREQHSNSIVPTFNKPLTDTDIEKLEKTEAVKQAVKTEAKEEEEEAVEVEAQASETIIAEMGKRARQAVSNYDASGSVGKAEIKSNINPNSVNKVVNKKAETSKVTPIKQDAENKKESIENHSMDEILDVINKQAEQKLAKEEVSLSQNSDDELDLDGLKAQQDTLAVEEAITSAEAEEELDRLVITKHEQNSRDQISQHIESEKTESDESQQRKISIEDFDEKETIADDVDTDKVDTGIELEEEITFEEMPHKDRRAKAKNKIEDVYPIIQVADNSKKGMKVLILGFVVGLVLASAISIGAVYLLLGNKQFENVINTAPLDNSAMATDYADKNAEIERVKLEAIQKERDAALAITKSLERERDAALATAKAQEGMREVERRTAEILAEQERKATRDLKKATKRARDAEIEAAKAKEREHKAKLNVMQSKIEADKKLQKAEENKIIKQSEIIEPKPAVTQKVKPVTEQVKIEKPIVKKENKSAKFSANPCNSPSSKFLSTCKK